MTIIEEFRARARKGIAAIEECESGATDRIDLALLDVYDLGDCPLAQSLGGGNYGHGLNKLGIAPLDDETAKFGFSLSSEETGDAYDLAPEEPDAAFNAGYKALRQAWVIELTEYRTAKAALVAD